MRGQLVEAEHLVRYWWVSQLAPGRRVLDAGCGLAYGTRLLHDAGATSADGIDISPSTVEAARAAVGPEIALGVGDVTALPFPDDAFDLVVCFEVIEHIEERDAALDEIARVLAPGGILAVSSPNRLQYPEGNPHHVHEYTPDELHAAAATRFPAVMTYRQQAWTASAILDDAAFAADQLQAPLALTSAKVSGRRPGEETYSVVLAGNGPLPVVEARSVLTGALELRRWLQLYDDQHALLDRQHAALSGARPSDDEVALLHRRLRETERRLAEVTRLRQREHDARRDLADARDALARETARAERAEGVSRDILGSSSWRVTAPLRRLKSLI